MKTARWTWMHWGCFVVLGAVIGMPEHIGASTVEWTNADVGDSNWSTTGNWNEPLANPTGDVPLFGTTDAGGTSLVDPQNLDPATTVWTVGGLNYLHNDPNAHVTDLGDNRLKVDGHLAVGQAEISDHNQWVSRAMLRNGTLQLGASGEARDLHVGRGVDVMGFSRITGHLTIGQVGATTDLELYLRDVFVGVGGHLIRNNRLGLGHLDLRQARIPGDGVVSVSNFYASVTHNAEAYIMFNEDTNLKHLKVADTLSLAGPEPLLHPGNILRFGDPENAYKLPGGFSLSIGDAVSNHRGLFYFGAGRGLPPGTGTGTVGTTDAFMTATSGGMFTAFLDLFEVGSCGQADNRLSNVHLDLREMEACDVDTIDLHIGTGDGTAKPTAKVYLPPGLLSVTNTIIGDTSTETPSSALLYLNGTRFVPRESLAIRHFGELECVIRDEDGGLDLIDDPTLTLHANARITIRFVEDAPAEGFRWGLRWPGNRVNIVAQMIGSNQLTFPVDAEVDGAATIYYDDQEDITYIAIAQSWPPLALAKDILYEFMPPAANVTVFPEDVDNGSFDPDRTDPPLTMTLAYPVEGPPQNSLTLTEGTYTVRLTVTSENGTDSADAVVTVAEPVTTTNDLTWTGGAAREAEPDRREWHWGANWSMDAAPAPHSTAVLTFLETGLGTVRIPDTRAAGTLRFRQNTLTPYVLDLTNETFTVTGGLEIGRTTDFPGTPFENTVSIEGGTLRLGTATDQPFLAVGYTEAGNIDSTLTIGSPARPTDLEIRLGAAYVGVGTDRNSQRAHARLDLRNARVVDGMFRAGNLIVAGEYASEGCIQFNADTGITAFEIADTFSLAGPEPIYPGNFGRLGDPDNAYMLPAGVSFVIGQPGSARGRFLLGAGRGLAHGTSTGGTTDAFITASSNGTFTAFLSMFDVGSAGNHINRKTEARLDLREMESCDIDAEDLLIGTIRTSGTLAGTPSARVWLPAGQVRAERLQLSDVDAHDDSDALLWLDGTRLTVTESLLVEKTGSLEARITDGTSGIYLDAETSALIVAAGGMIALDFQYRGVGISWPGDHVDTLETLIAEERLIWVAEPGINVDLFTASGVTILGAPTLAGTLLLLR